MVTATEYADSRRANQHNDQVKGHNNQLSQFQTGVRKKLKKLAATEKLDYEAFDAIVSQHQIFDDDDYRVCKRLFNEFVVKNNLQTW